MARGLRVIRGMIGTGLTFAAGMGGLAVVGGLIAMLMGRIDPIGVFALAARIAVPSFILGVAFAGFLAIAGRVRTFDKLSLRLVSALGAGAGLLFFGLTAMGGGRTWAPRDAIANLIVLPLMGAVSAAVMLIIARRARRGLPPSDEPDQLGEGPIEVSLAERRRTGQKVNR